MLVSADAVSLVRSNRALVDKVSVQVNAGEMVGLIGPNGAGKSTLMSMLAGLITPSEGSVLLDGIPIDQVSVAERSRQLAWLEQTGPIHWPLTVERLVTLGRRPHLNSWHRPTQADRSAVDQAIRVTDCVHLRNQDATTLSGGERARVMLARALASEPRVLLADEPVSSLDIGHQLQTMDLLREYATQNQGCMVVLHDLSLAARYCDRLYLLDHGKLVAEGLPTSVLTDDNLEKVYSVRVERDAALQGWILPISLI